MKVLRLINRIKGSEGRRLEVYQDHLGIWSIGFGTTHFLGERVTADWKKITVKRANDMLHLEIMNSMIAASKSVKNFDDLDNIRQEALVELVYQLGARGWMLFAKTRKYIEQGHWLEASEEIKDSALWRDKATRGRCERYAAMLLFGKEYAYLMETHNLQLQLV